MTFQYDPEPMQKKWQPQGPANIGPSSARPSPEPQGHCERSRLATGSLPVSEAVALADEWLARSIKCNQRCIEACREGAEDFATANSVRSATYLLCADELRQRIGLPISRQPEENA